MPDESTFKGRPKFNSHRIVLSLFIVRYSNARPEKLKVGMHSLGYIAETTQQAADEFFPGFARAFTRIGKERGWPPITRAYFDEQIGPTGALLVGSPEDVAKKIARHSEALGRLDRVMIKVDDAGLPHANLMRAIELIRTKVAPALRSEILSTDT